MPKLSLKHEWPNHMADWLSTMPWTWFATFTTPYEMTPKSGRRLMERTFQSYSKLSNGRCTLMYAMEPNELRDGYHIHALLRMPKRFTGRGLFQTLLDMYRIKVGGKVKRNDNGMLTYEKGHNARVQLLPYDKKKKAGWYLTKYMVKKNGIDHWDIYTPLDYKPD